MRKTKTFQINIPNPCDEKWSEMTPTKGGRHCDRCEKTIVDFSTKTDREIAHLYKASDGKICGRFAPDQLKREIVLQPKSPSRSMSKAAAVLLSGMLSAGTAAAQGEVTIQRTEQHITEKENEKITPPGMKTISGQVTHEWDVLPFANVYVEGTTIGTTTDIDGKYSLEIPENAVTLLVNYIGYDDARVEVAAEQNTVDIVMEDHQMRLSVGIVITTISDYSYAQDPPRGRTLPRLIRDWIQNIKEKRSKRKAKPQAEITTTHQSHTPETESEVAEIRPPKTIANRLITNIFPNPFDNKIHVTLEAETTEILSLVIYDSMSRVIYSEEIHVLFGTNEVEVNLKEKQLINGSYFLSILSGGEAIQTEILTRIK